MQLLALALELKTEGYTPQIVTDDYSIQNLAAYLGIVYRPVGMKGIKRVLKWKYKCIGCGRIFDEKIKECPICGSSLRSVRSRKN
jgi:UPF0271 protein